MITYQYWITRMNAVAVEFVIPLIRNLIFDLVYVDLEIQNDDDDDIF